MKRVIASTHNLDALTNDERIIVAAGREAWVAITKTFDTWTVLGEAIVVLRAKATAIGGRKTFLRLLDANGLGMVDAGEISRLEKIMANLDAVRAWHRTLPLNRQIAWSSPSSVIRQATAADGARQFPPKKKGGGNNKPVQRVPSIAAKNSELDAANERAKEQLEEELANSRDGKDFKNWPLAERRQFVTNATLDLLIKSAAPAEQEKLRKVSKPSGDIDALRSAYALAMANKAKMAKSKAAQLRTIKDEENALQKAIRAAMHDPAAEVNAVLGNLMT